MPFVRATFQTVMATVAVVLILAVIAIGVGLGVGYRPVIITTGSMTPTAPTGSLLIAGPADRVGPGDILVMRRDGRATVTHRIVEVEYNADGDPYAVTRGDANAEIDAAPYAIGNLELTGRWVVPGFGRVLLAMGSPLVAVTVVSLAVAVVALGLLRRIWASSGSEAGGPVASSVGRRKRSKRVRMAGTSMFLGVTMAGSGVAWSLYLGVASVGSNVFATAECFDDRLAGVQKGTTVNSAAGIQAFAIAPVDPTRSFLQISAHSASNEPADSQVMARLVDASTIEITRQTDAGSPPPITIEWSVVEYACGVSVQRGVSVGDGSAQVDTTISTVDRASSFVLTSATAEATASDFDGDDLTIVELADSSTVRVRTSGAPLPISQQTAWQVVTFDDPGDASTQIASGTLGAGTATTTVALASPVDVRATFVLAQMTSSSTGPQIGERLVRVRLLDSSTIEISRLATSEAVDVQVQIVELTDGTTVRRGVIDLGPGQTAASVTIPPLDPGRSTVGSTVMVPGSASGGATDHAADDVVGEASATAVLDDAATVTLERGASASNASFAWQAITWGGPAWADPLTPFRQRIDITAGGVDAPNGYTTPLTLDHSSLVSTGLALANGDDARIWRYDGTSWTELDRVLDETSSWNNASTTVWFRTQESITANDRISYWLYFGNPTPPPVLDDPSKVWLLREGFEGGTLGFFEDRTTGSGWYRAEPWTRRQPLTIDSSTVSSPLTDQPVLVRLTDPDLTTFAQADGSDFR
ncbi:MAG: signal peptidase I, partial [Acidimicrobiia bacterium]